MVYCMTGLLSMSNQPSVCLIDVSNHDLTYIYIVTTHLIRWVSHQDHIEEFLMKQEYTSAHTYKLNLNDLIIKILQI
jgi:hypothetical protein